MIKLNAIVKYKLNKGEQLCFTLEHNFSKCKLNLFTKLYVSNNVLA